MFMKRLLILLIIFSQLLTFCSTQDSDLKFKTDFFQISLNKTGQISEFLELKSGTNYLVKDETSPLISVRVQNDILSTESIKLDKENEVYVVSFTEDIQAKIKIEQKSSHITFELIEISNKDNIELITWGAYPTSINRVIGETIGVVQGKTFSIGLQALNEKTLGGYPWNENDCMPQIDIFEQGDFTDMSEKGKRHVLYRVEAAKPTENGSSLQAYCRNRTEERIIKNWGHEKYTASTFEDGGVIGSKIALFGCPVEKTLETIGAIEIAEGLPHPQIDGQWGKTATSASAAYMIMGFGEKDFEKSLEATQKAGLHYLYQSGPFETWGHFKLDEKQFPNGIESFKQCVKKAEAEGVMLGVHTLSNFITTNDLYVTPIPDKRLAKVGSSFILGNIDKIQTEVPIESPDFFNQFKNNHLKSVVIENEIIRYGAVSETAPWRLQDCQRGAFGTTASEHKDGEVISKLADHAYKVFLTNPELTIEMSKNIADFFNQTGCRQISFDGLEGNRSTGMGNYGEILFTKTWYDNLDDKIKNHYIVDASRTSHFFWHMYTRMNWGEPWYAGFRESQTEYRLKNQKYFKRNLMPGMLGWFKMTPETSVEDIEWMLARSAAFNAGYGFVTNYETLDRNGNTDKILSLLGQWEKARMSQAFSEGQKQRMEDIKNEFQLKTISENEWQLNQVYSFKFKHEKKVRQPGEPTFSTFNFENPVSEQTMNFILTTVDGEIKNSKLEIDNYKELVLPISLKAGETLKYSGKENAVIYNKNWHKLNEIKIDTALFTLSKGDHNIIFDCDFSDGKEPLAKLEVRIIGPDETVKAK